MRTKARTVTVELTLQDCQILRGLIAREATRFGHPFQRPSEEPSKLRRLKPVAKKIWEARQSFDGVR